MGASVACFIQIFGIGNKSQKSDSFIGADRMDDQIRDPTSLPMLEDAWVVKTSRGRILCIEHVRRRVAEALENNGASSAQALRMSAERPASDSMPQ